MGCNKGQIIGGISKVLYGQPTGTCNCPQRGSDEESEYFASLPPSLSEPQKCGTDFKYTGVTPILKERCCALEALGSGSGDLRSLNFKAKTKCVSDLRQTRSSDLTEDSSGQDGVCASDASAAGESGRNTFAWDIVYNACNGKEKCEVLVDDFTGWDASAKTL